MSLYYLQKFLYVLNRDETAQIDYRNDFESLIAKFNLTDEEKKALRDEDVGLLYVLGVNAQLLMHYAAFLGIEWSDYIGRMRKGVEKHGAVRAGVYGMRSETES